ncbi:4Fe-4S binding protein [Pirellulaceae bacterium SH467]
MGHLVQASRRCGGTRALLDVAVSEESRPIDYNPCVHCKLCVAACPVGAISSDGEFNFSTCPAHSYREFMSGLLICIFDTSGIYSRLNGEDDRGEDECSRWIKSKCYGFGVARLVMSSAYDFQVHCLFQVSDTHHGK